MKIIKAAGKTALAVAPIAGAGMILATSSDAFELPEDQKTPVVKGIEKGLGALNLEEYSPQVLKGARVVEEFVNPVPEALIPMKDEEQPRETLGKQMQKLVPFGGIRGGF